MEVTLLGRYAIEGTYGTTTIHRLADRDGNALPWFASNDQIVDEGVGHEAEYLMGKASMVVGCSYRVKATVKKHDTYKGQRQTVVRRIVVQPIAQPKKSRKRKAKNTKQQDLNL